MLKIGRKEKLMKRYDMDEHYWEEWDSLMEETVNGRWIKWEDVNDFVIYIIGTFKRMGLKKNEIKHILDEYKSRIYYLGESK